MVMTDIGGALVQDFGYVLGYLESIYLNQVLTSTCLRTLATNIRH